MVYLVAATGEPIEMEAFMDFCARSSRTSRSPLRRSHLRVAEERGGEDPQARAASSAGCRPRCRGQARGMSSADESGPTPLEASLDLGVPAARLTLGSFLDDVTARYAERTALVSGSDRWTYATSARRAGASPRHCAAAGVTKGTRVACSWGIARSWPRPSSRWGCGRVAVIPMTTFAAAPGARPRDGSTATPPWPSPSTGWPQNAYLDDLARDHPEVTAPARSVRRCPSPSCDGWWPSAAGGGRSSLGRLPGPGAPTSGRAVDAAGVASSPTTTPS